MLRIARDAKFQKDKTKKETKEKKKLNKAFNMPGSIFSISHSSQNHHQFLLYIRFIRVALGYILRRKGKEIYDIVSPQRSFSQTDEQTNRDFDFNI